MVNLIDRFKAFANPMPASTAGLEDEISSSDSIYYNPSTLKPYNPDFIYQKKGSLETYDTMKRDDIIKACLFLKKHAVISTGWDIVPASENPQDKEIASFVQNCFTDYFTGQFNEKLYEIMSAIEYGYSVTEKIYRYDEGVGKWVIKTLKTRAPHSFEFHADEYGNLPPESGLQQTDRTGHKYPLNPSKFIIYVYNGEFGNWYGSPDLAAAYRSWFSKDIIIRFWNVYLDRFGMPPVIAKYGAGATKAERERVKTILDNIQTKTSMVLPQGFEISLLEVIKRGEAGYESAVSAHNTMIARSIMIPDLLGFTDKEGGSYALGKKQFDGFLWVLNKLKADVENILFEQVIKELVSLNFNVKTFPKFRVKAFVEQDKHELGRLMIDALANGVIKPDIYTENYLRGLFGLPEVEEIDTGTEAGATYMQHYRAKGHNHAYVLKFNRALNQYEKKVDFAMINSNLNESAAKWEGNLKDLIKDMRDDLTTQVVSKRIIDDRKINEVRDIEIKYTRDLTLKLKQFLRDQFDLGTKTAKAELKKNYGKVVGQGLDAKEALAYFEQKAFMITGVIRKDLEAAAQRIIADGIKTGKTTKDVVYALDELFEPYVATKEIEGSVADAGRLSTIIRTNQTDAFNQGRLIQYRNPDLEGFVEAVEYAAVIDDVTTEYCREMDGRIFGMNNPELDAIKPPAHFNCRSLLVPVVQGESWMESDQPKGVERGKGFE